MHESTSVRVAATTRDAVRALADDDGISLDEEIRRLARAERQRRMGHALATAVPTGEDEQWLESSADAVDEAAGAGVDG